MLGPRSIRTSKTLDTCPLNVHSSVLLYSSRWQLLVDLVWFGFIMNRFTPKVCISGKYIIKVMIRLARYLHYSLGNRLAKLVIRATMDRFRITVTIVDNSRPKIRPVVRFEEEED